MYIGCFQDTVFQDPPHLYNYYSTMKCLHSKYLNLTPRQMCTKVTNLVLRGTALVSFPDDGFLQIKT